MQDFPIAGLLFTFYLHRQDVYSQSTACPEINFHLRWPELAQTKKTLQ